MQRWMLVVIAAGVLVTGWGRIETVQAQSFGSPSVVGGSVWYLREQDTGVKALGNVDNDGKSIYCITEDDCKMIYYDNTNKDLKFFDCDDSGCTRGTATTVDTAGDVGQEAALYCPTAADCKIAYLDATNVALNFFDCDDAACTTGTKRVLDGGEGCVLHGGGSPCDSVREAGHYPAIYCPGADNCKIAYRANHGGGLFFADCEDSSCGSGTVNVVDMAAGCSLTGCILTGPAEHISLYCPTAADCKISLKDGKNEDLRFEDCDDEQCGSGTARILDGGSGCSLIGGAGCDAGIDTGRHSVIYCPSATDCKIAYTSNTYSSLRFADCDDGSCSTGSVSYLDGEPGCSLTGCIETLGIFHPSLYCPTAADCKISFRDVGMRELRFADCDDGSCSAGNITIVDGSGSCGLDNCSAADNVGRYDSIFCLTEANCKIVYYDESGGNVKFADCGDGQCNSGAVVTVDGNKMSRTPGAVTTAKTFGKSPGQVVTWVSDEQFPDAGGAATFPAGDYNLYLDLTNRITSGALVFRFHVGWCTAVSDCQNKTAVLTSGDITFDATTGNEQVLAATLPTPQTLTGDPNSNWLYVDLETVSVATGDVDINSNGSPGSGDSRLEIPQGGGVVTVTSAADTMVNANKPTTIYGQANNLGADNVPVIRSLARFDVSGIPLGASVTGATLQLYVNDGSDAASQVSNVVGTWDEATTNWNNTPEVGSLVGSFTALPVVDTWSAADVSGVVSGNGIYNFYITSASANGVGYNPREAGSNIPTLTVTYSW